MTCSIEDVQCEYTEDNLIDNLGHVYSEEECRLICLDNEECQFITYFNASAKPVPNICRIFKTCDSVLPSENCVSQNMECFDLCSSNIIGLMDENVIDIVMNIETENACKDLCTTTNPCSWYTYFNENDPTYHETCFLLKDLLPPLEVYKTETVSTGPQNCTKICPFDIYSSNPQSLMLTEDDTDRGDMEVNVLSTGTCTLRVLAVGGGGRGSGRDEGGGSGFVKYQIIDLEIGPHTLQVHVGTENEASYINIDNGTMMISADRGGSGIKDGKGGDGYSGGGDKGNDGGTDGGAGGGPNGGHGTGENITEFSFNSWILSPGKGGEKFEGRDGGGGGGGGVLVDEEGPRAEEWTGQGYGGGGCGKNLWTQGLPGVVLLETVLTNFGGLMTTTTTTDLLSSTTSGRSCDELCIGVSDYQYVGEYCSGTYCFCTYFGAEENYCQEGHGWCQEREECTENCENSCSTTDPPSTVESTTFGSFCEMMCITGNIGENGFTGDYCSETYCWCAYYGPSEYPCSNDNRFCPDQNLCIENCENSC